MSEPRETARQIAEQVVRDFISLHQLGKCRLLSQGTDCRCYLCMFDRALSQATATAEAEHKLNLDSMTASAAHWRRKAESAEAQLTEARRQVWEAAVKLAEAEKLNDILDAEDRAYQRAVGDVIDVLRSAYVALAQTEETR